MWNHKKALALLGLALATQPTVARRKQINKKSRITLATQQEQIRTHNNEIAELQTIIGSHEDDLRQLHNRFDALTKHIASPRILQAQQKQKNMLAHLQKDLTILQATVNAHKQEKVQINTVITQMQKDVAALQEQFKSFTKSQIKDHAGTLTTLQTELVRIKHEIAALQKALSPALPAQSYTHREESEPLNRMREQVATLISQ